MINISFLTHQPLNHSTVGSTFSFFHSPFSHIHWIGTQILCFLSLHSMISLFLFRLLSLDTAIKKKKKNDSLNPYFFFYFYNYPTPFCRLNPNKFDRASCLSLTWSPLLLKSYVLFLFTADLFNVLLCISYFLQKKKERMWNPLEVDLLASINLSDKRNHCQAALNKYAFRWSIQLYIEVDH